MFNCKEGYRNYLTTEEIIPSLSGVIGEIAG
jgi:hypothetical protein